MLNKNKRFGVRHLDGRRAANYENLIDDLFAEVVYAARGERRAI
jgi:hypothetical protein